MLDAPVGFPVSAVQGFIEDRDAFFWMTSGHRIVRARRDDLHAWADGQTGRHFCQVFDASDGLPPAVFSVGRQPACARDERGRLWFATSRGVAMTDPAAFRLNGEPPRIHVEGISFHRPVSLAGNGR